MRQTRLDPVRLAPRDQEAALKFIREAYRARDLDKFVTFILATLPSLISSEVTSHDDMQPRKAYPKNWINLPFLMRPKRDSLFTKRERALIGFLRPHLIQAPANALAVSKLTQENARISKVLEVIDRGVLILKSDRTVGFATPIALDLLFKYLDHPPRSERLPETLELWVRQHDFALQPTVGPPDAVETVIERKQERLLIRMFSLREELLLILEEQRSAITPASLRSLGLTSRESEVLALAANGCSSEEIAARLAMGLRTVHSHFEHIYEELGVNSRAAAAARAFRAAVSTNIRNRARTG